jgi:hypothetical protein
VFCPQCGASQQTGARFCPMCGTALGATAAEPPESALASSPAPSQAADPPASTGGGSGLSPSQVQQLQREISERLLDPCRQRVTGYVGADDRQFLIELLKRAATNARFRTALAYVIGTRDVMAFETNLDHPEQALPLRIEMWAERQSKGAQARSVPTPPTRPGGSGHAIDYVLCPRGHRAPWYAPSCPTCGSAVGATAPPAPAGGAGYGGRLRTQGQHDSTAIVLIIGGVVAIVAGWILLAVTATTNTLCNSVLGQVAQQYGGMSTAQCTGAAIGNGVGLCLVIVGVVLALSGILAGILRLSASRAR